LKFKVIINHKPQLGAFSSLIIALNQIRNNSDVFVLPIDVPLISATKVNLLVNAKSLVSIPTYNCKGGHPVKLHPIFWESLKQIDLESNDARLDYQIKKIEKKHIEYIEVNDKNVILNLNTPKLWNDYLQ